MFGPLIKYAEDKGLKPEPGFAPKYVRWLIVLDNEGNFLDVVELGETEAKKNRGQRFPKCPDLSQPELTSGSETKCHFLVETVDVVTLFGSKADDSKVKEKHNYFISTLTKASQEIPELKVIVKSLSNSQILKQIHNRLEALGAKPSDKITFKVNDVVIVESDIWHKWWREFRANIVSSKKSSKRIKIKAENLMRCFATGELTLPVPTHSKISGLFDVGGKASGDALVCFDKEAFQSYYLEQSANAAFSEEAMCAYRDALNDLIIKTGFKLGNTKVIHWFKQSINPEDDPLKWLEESPEQQERTAQHLAREMLNSLKSGKRPDLADNYYYALTLSGAAGRIIVRDWMEGQFEALVQNINDWYDDLTIINSDGTGYASLPKFYGVLGSVVRKLDDLTAPFVSRMWRVAINGEIFPLSALSQALERMRADIYNDQSFNQARMGLIKAYFVRKQRLTGGDFMSAELKPYLNEEHPHPAYQCGRLMAVLAKLQQAALGDVGAGIIQRYYAAASTTPALVLGRLIKMAQFHLNKLEGGLAHWYEEKISSIACRLKDNLPKTLTLEEQGLFALGYYQQWADLRTKKEQQ